MFNNSFTLSENPTPEDFREGIASLFENHWFTGYNYRKTEGKTFESKELETELRQNPFFIAHLHYILTLDNSLNQYRFQGLDGKITNELTHWDKEGGLCMFLSVLLYGLLTSDNVVTEEEIQLIQGYYSFRLREDFPEFLPMPKNQSGLHAWLRVKGSVLDISINQNERFFDFKGVPFIMNGIIPDGMKLVGFPEIKRTVHKYMRKFAKYQGMKMEEWLQFHREQSIQIFLDKDNE